MILDSKVSINREMIAQIWVKSVGKQKTVQLPTHQVEVRFFLSLFVHFESIYALKSEWRRFSLGYAK